MSLRIQPLAQALGAEVQGIDLQADLSDAVFAEIIAAWRRYQVLLFRDQDVGDDRLVPFARQFGELDPAPYLDAKIAHPPGFPEITVVSNVEENGAPIGSLGHSELTWHSDMTYQEAPPVGCILHAWETPQGEGATWFTSLRAGLATLPAALREQLAGRHGFHDKTITSAGTLRHGTAPTTTPRPSQGSLHPFLIRHPSWGEETLLLGRRKNAYVDELPDDQSEALLDQIWDHITQPEFALQHFWRPGDVVIWDNLLTLHRRDAFDGSKRRILHRAQVRRLHPHFLAA